MNESQLKKLAESKAIGNVTLYNQGANRGYEIWAYDTDECLDLNNYGPVGAFGNRLYTMRGEIKTYTSIDRAVAALRELGYTSKIIIEG